MSAIGGKADMTIGTCPLSWSLSGVKQTSLVAAHMSACDPKRTSAGISSVEPDFGGIFLKPLALQTLGFKACVHT
jgi:hypothetical protein